MKKNPAELKIEIYRKMLEIRFFEEKVKELFQQGLIHGPTHLYIGEEAIAVGACFAIEKKDHITSTHRGHGHCIAKGGDVKLMMAELIGKETGYCKGRGGSMHIADLDIGILGANGIVGAGIPIAVGAGLTSSYRKDKRVIVCFFGDGASNTGNFHEAINLASVWHLPVVFICENNLYAVTTPFKEASLVENIVDRARCYGIHGVIADGNDVEEVYRITSEAVEKARDGKGPTLVECKTYRWEGHYVGDPIVYRTREEENLWKRKDPIQRYRERLIKNKIITEEDDNKIGEEIKDLIEEAKKFAKESQSPVIENIFDDLYCEDLIIEEPTKDTHREITYAQALNEALDNEMERDSNVIIIGEDVGLHGGAFQVTKGLWKKYGDNRVRNTPISESAIVGTGIGASITGLRPVVEIMYTDFMTLAMDQIVNQAAKNRYMFGGKAKLPLVIRTQSGTDKGGGAQHSQSLESWFCHIPGLKVVMPGTPYDAKGLLISAIRDNNPVIFIEYKALYQNVGMVPRGGYTIPLGKAEIKRNGTDVTIITWGLMVPRVLKSAELLNSKGINVEVVDIRTLKPLDMETIINSVKKTGKVIIVHAACKFGGFGAEISAQITERAFDYLDASVVRIAGLDIPVPYNTVQEKAVLPDEETIVKAIEGIIE